MKLSKLALLLSLILGNCSPPLIFVTVVGLSLPHPGAIVCWLHLLTIGVLIASFYSNNEKTKGKLETASLVLSAIYYWSLQALLPKPIPFPVQLPFLISFGSVLYFRLLTYFNREKATEADNETLV